MQNNLERIGMGLATIGILAVGFQWSWNCWSWMFGLPEINIFHGLSFTFVLIAVPVMISMAWHSQVNVNTVQHIHYQVNENKQDTEEGGS